MQVAHYILSTVECHQLGAAVSVIVTLAAQVLGRR